MENKCRMCGQCCRKIHIDAQACWDINDGKNPTKVADFIRENWEYLGSSEDIGGFTIKDYYGSDVYFGVYQCKLVSEDNMCTIHDNKPEICSGYPWYNHGKSEKSIPWPYPGCGYEKDAKELNLIKVLNKIIEKRGNNETERKEGKSDLLKVCKT